MNIEIHGNPDDVEGIRLRIIDSMKEGAEEETLSDCVVTIVNSRSDSVIDGKSSSFYRIFSDSEEDFEKAFEILKDIRLNPRYQFNFMECILLHKTFVFQK